LIWDGLGASFALESSIDVLLPAPGWSQNMKQNHNFRFLMLI
jgi:hypothetical protein